MSDLRSRVPAQALMERTLELHGTIESAPSGGSLSWYTGALGEIVVAGILSSLGPEWTVLHSVPVGRGDTDIDHVVIGPAGVFTINTKNHPGQKIWVGGHGLLVSGHGTTYIPAAIREAQIAETRLSAIAGLTIPVVPLIVLVNPGRRTQKVAADGGVRVIADSELLQVFADRAVFSAAQVDRIVAAAVQPSTWHSNPRPDDSNAAVAIRFNAIMARAAQASLASPSKLHVAGARKPAASARRSKKSSSDEVVAKLLVGAVALLVASFGVIPALLGSVAP